MSAESERAVSELGDEIAQLEAKLKRNAKSQRRVQVALSLLLLVCAALAWCGAPPGFADALTLMSLSLIILDRATSTRGAS